MCKLDSSLCLNVGCAVRDLLELLFCGVTPAAAAATTTAGVPYDEGWRVEVKIRIAGPALGTGEPGTRIDTVSACCCASVCWAL